MDDDGTTSTGSPAVTTTKPPGVKDVAAAAGVSWKTVSNVVNGTGRVGAATRGRVERVIADLGYRPNLAGRQLRQGRTGILALAVPQIDSPYFSTLAHETIEVAAARGYRVLIDETRGVPEAERLVARGFDVRLIDGIVFSPLDLSLDDVDELRGSTPMVLLGERPWHPGGALTTDHVSIDNVAAAREATRHLLGTGRRRLAFLGAEPDVPERSGAPRQRGFVEELRAAGLEVRPPWLLPVADYSRRSGARAVEDVLPRAGEIDGLVCGNDLLALGAMHALRTNGVRVPEDVGVVGWDNTEDGRYANPGLTTIAPDVRGVAEAAVGRLVAQVERTGGAPEDVVVPHRLLVRESSRRQG
ncbi:LacI family DNA-binding transcriptional regulator [Isoptericola sp. NPDC060257]|uniref:LacI family DNA-binding transcriptional regulator n=1 Tax=Isoptericola sp. NPDC060257 TaxID=3347087 RepID=UPI0036657831